MQTTKIANFGGCKREFKFRPLHGSFLSLSRAIKPDLSTIAFTELFEDKIALTLDDYKCESCHHKHDKLVQKEFFNFESLNFLLIRIETCHPTKKTFLDVEILEFDPDHITIPGSKCIFKLMSVVLFFPYKESKCDNGGHYICIRRCKSGWLSISDSAARIVNFDKKLKNAYILFLVKK